MIDTPNASVTYNYLIAPQTRIDPIRLINFIDTNRSLSKIISPDGFFLLNKTCKYV